jgi:hypothetical protein
LEEGYREIETDLIDKLKSNDSQINEMAEANIQMNESVEKYKQETEQA